MSNGIEGQRVQLTVIASFTDDYICTIDPCVCIKYNQDALRCTTKSVDKNGKLTETLKDDIILFKSDREITVSVGNKLNKEPFHDIQPQKCSLDNDERELPLVYKRGTPPIEAGAVRIKMKRVPREGDEQKPTPAERAHQPSNKSSKKLHEAKHKDAGKSAGGARAHQPAK